MRPQQLQAGDKVAAISLSWGGAATFPKFPNRYALGKRRLEEIFGVQVVETRHALREASWLAANPKVRADDLMEAFADSQIKGIFSIVGGEDSIRLLPHIDLKAIAQNPKVFIGYSDTTVNHFVCLKAGLSSFYGSSILAEFAENGALQKVVRDECGLLDLPIMTQMDFGHSAPQMVLPMGAMAEIDCERKAFSILESGVLAAPTP